MKNSELVGRLDAVGDLPQQTDCAFDRQSTFAAQQFMQRLALDIFHHEIKDAVVGFAKIGNADGVRMLYRCRGLCLAFEAGDRLAFLQVVAVQNVLPNGFYGHAFSFANFLSLAR